MLLCLGIANNGNILAILRQSNRALPKGFFLWFSGFLELRKQESKRDCRQHVSAADYAVLNNKTVVIQG